MLVFNCSSNGWMTEKECIECFKNHKYKQYGHVKHCINDNVKSIEDSNNTEE